MKTIVLFFILLVSACSDNAAINKANFEDCVERAEDKYQEAFSRICRKTTFDKAGTCSYNIDNNNALIRSKDNEITACATMYAPKR